jgi:alpha-L-arabinofuranosidase
MPKRVYARHTGRPIRSQEGGFQILRNRSSTLNAAIAETQTKATALKKETSTRIALVQARAAALKARIALEIEQSPKEAGQALEEAQGYLAKAKASASKRTAEGIAQLELDAQAAKQAVTESVSEAKDKTNALVVHTEEQLQAYGKQVTESEEAVLLKKRYAELEAQAALLKAQLAASADATQEQAQSYLDEAKAWYARAKSQAGETAQLELQKMQKRIDNTKDALKEGGKQAGKKLSDLLKWAAERVEVKEEE